MDYTSIAAAIAATKAAGEMLAAAVSLTADTKALTHINDARHQVANVITALLDTQTDLLKLQSENQELREQIRRHDDWENTKAQYRMVTTPGGATVYESIENSSKHFVCPNCFASKVIIPLQSMDGGYFYNCPRCERSSYQIRDPSQLPPPKVEKDWDPWE